MVEVITDNLDLWTSALLTKSTAGRGSNRKLEAYGIKKLRELILELAVRGKLVPQDTSDEPAAELLKNVAKEKARLTKEGKLAKQKPLPDIDNHEAYSSLPIGWVWSRLGEITNYGITDKAEPSDVAEDTWVLDLEDVEKETSKLLQKARYSDKPFLSSKNRFVKGDVIYGKLRPYLDKVIVADEDGVCTTEMIPVRGYASLSPFYLRLVMKTPHFINYADDSTHGMNLPRLGTDKARMALFPLAPYNEQCRIVAKVDELMTLCDQLEQRQTDSLAAHQTLVETLLVTLTRVETQQEFSAAWARIASHFDTLFTTEASIDQLKQTILQLAVMGKLVPQDPNDEPASRLLERISAEKNKLVAQRRIKREKPLSAVKEKEKPYQLPDSWAWARIGVIATSTDYGLSEKTFSDESGVPVLKMGDIVNGQVVLGGQKTVATNTEGLPELLLGKGDLLYNRTNSAELVGKTGLYSGPSGAYTFASYLIRIRLANELMAPEFLNISMNSPIFRETQIVPHLKQQCGQANVNGTIMRNMRVPVPPYAEQHRIVAKVDELMALCDTLKVRLADAKTTQLHLADAIVEQTVC